MEIVAANVALVLLLIFVAKRFFNVQRKFAKPAADGAVVVTGATSGIGFAAAAHLARKGFTVFAGCRDVDDPRIEKLREAAGSGEAAKKIVPVAIDVTKQETVSAAAAAVAEAVGGRGIVGLVNSAGSNIGPYPVEFVDTTVLAHQLDVNVTGQVRVVQAFMPLLRQAQGRIIFMSSVAGKIAGNFQGPYAASKFAIEVRSLAACRPACLPACLSASQPIERPVTVFTLPLSRNHSAIL